MAELKRNTVPGEKPAAAEKTRVSGIRGLLACSRSTKRNLVTYTMVVLAYVVVQVLIGTKVISFALAGQMVPICVYIVMAVSLNLVVGISGELSLGHAGFMSVGAFTGVVVMALLAPLVPDTGVRLVLTMIIAGVLAGLVGVGVGIPVMRLRGDYLAIVTLAFGEIIKNVLNNLYVGIDKNGLHVSLQSTKALGMEGGALLINGPQGASGITKASTFFMGLILVLFCLFVVLNLIHSRSGRAIMAIRDNRIAVESVGISTTKYRLMAFAVSAALAGMAGALYAMNFSSIVPKKFDFNLSIMILVFVVLGGMGNVRGSIISAAVLTVLPEALRFLADWRMLLYAVVLIFAMLLGNNEQLKAWRERMLTRLRLERRRAVAAQTGSQAAALQAAVAGSQAKEGDAHE